MISKILHLASDHSEQDCYTNGLVSNWITIMNKWSQICKLCANAINISVYRCILIIKFHLD